MEPCARLVVLLALLFTVSCQQSAQSAVGGSVGDLTARRAIDLVQQGRMTEVLQVIDPTALSGDATETLQQVQAVLPGAGTSTIDPVLESAHKWQGRDRIEEQLTYHVKGQDRAALVFVTTTTESGVTRLQGFRANPAPLDLRDAYPFRLAGMSLLHYMVLLLAVTVPVFMLVTAVACIRSQRRRKWLWLAFSLVAIGQFGIQWAVGGQYFLRLFSVQFLGAFVSKFPIYDPWIVGASVPLGAILFWATNRKKATATEVEGPAQQLRAGSAVIAPEVTVNPIRYFVGVVGFLLAWFTIAVVVSLVMVAIFPLLNGSPVSVGIGLGWRCLPGVILGTLAGIHSFRASVRGRKSAISK